MKNEQKQLALLLADGSLDDARHGVAVLSGLNLPSSERRIALRGLTRWLVGPACHDLSGLDLRDIDLRGLGLGARLDGSDLTDAAWDGAWDCGVSLAEARGVPAGTAKALEDKMIGAAGDIHDRAQNAKKRNEAHQEAERWANVGAPVGSKIWFLLGIEHDEPFETFPVGVAWGGVPKGDEGDGWMAYDNEECELCFYATPAQKALAADPYEFSRVFLSACKPDALQDGLTDGLAPTAGGSLASWWVGLDREAQHAVIAAVADDPSAFLDEDGLGSMLDALRDEYYDVIRHPYGDGLAWTDSWTMQVPETPLSTELKALLKL